MLLAYVKTVYTPLYANLSTEFSQQISITT